MPVGRSVDQSAVVRPASARAVEPMVRLVAAGDLIFGDTPLSMGFGVGSRYPGPAARATLDGVEALLRRGDLVFANLEGNLRPDAEGERTVMCADPEVAHVMRQAGISVVNVANNHSMEHGRDGFLYTVRCLKESGLAVVGLRGPDDWGCEPVVIQPNGSSLSIGFLGYSCRPAQFAGDRDPLHAVGEEVTVLRDTVRLRERCDAVVVSLHWGEDHVEAPSAGERAFGQRILDAGATLILGHHPQVVRAVELCDRGAIAYSLGTLVGDHTWLPRTRRGMVIEVELATHRIASARVTYTRLRRDFRPVLASRAPRTVTPGPIRALSSVAYSRARRRVALIRRIFGGLHVVRHFGSLERKTRRRLVERLVTGILRGRPEPSVHGRTVDPEGGAR